MDNYLKAYNYFQNASFSQAQTILQAEILKDEKQARVYHLLGLVCFHQALFKQALKHLNMAVSLKPTETEYVLNLSIVLNELGLYMEAKKTYLQAVNLKQSSYQQNWQKNISVKHLQVARSYFENKHFSQSLKEYSKVLHFDSSNNEAKKAMAICLRRLGKCKEATKLLEHFVVKEPLFLNAKLQLAQWYFEDGDIPHAINEWESVLYKDPQNPQALRALKNIQNMGPENLPSTTLN